MATHNAVATVAIRAPLAIIQAPTVLPVGREVLVHVEWTASTPLDLHQSDGGLLVEYPGVLGDGLAGTVARVGPDVRNLAVGDKVFGFVYKDAKSKAHQEFATVAETSLGKVPEGFALQAAVTVPNNTVSVFHALTADLSLPLPWPRPSVPKHSHTNTPILIWGGASSSGQYALQVLSAWGYKNLLTTASPQHHEYLHNLGARHTFDYRDADVAKLILETAKEFTSNPAVPYILDCIGSQSGSLFHLAQIAQEGTRIAVLLPVILNHATEDKIPQYSFDIQAAAEWANGVETRGVRTHFYESNEFFQEQLQPTIIPALLAGGLIKPNRQKIVNGKTLLERAQNALDMLRRREVNGERLVWRISENSSSEQDSPLDC